MTRMYILKDGQPLEVHDFLTWARWFETAERHIGLTQRDEIRVSTVFLGLDHRFVGSRPILYETVIFGGEHDQYQSRCSTREQALEIHKRACELVWGKD